MGALQATVFFLILLKACEITDAEDEEWKTATFNDVAEGACGYGDLHKTSYGKYSAGLSTILFNRGSTCGACYELRCVDHILWCLQGSPSVILTATDFCPPNYGLSADYGGWCNFPKEHFEMSEAAFACCFSRIILAYTGTPRFTNYVVLWDDTRSTCIITSIVWKSFYM